MSLSRKVAGGAAWMMVQAVASRVIGFLGQIVLAWLLAPEDFGLISLALTVSSFGDVIRYFGVSDVFIKRYRKVNLWTAPSHQLAVTTSTGAGLLMVLAAPFAGWVYHSSTVCWLVMILAGSFPIGGFGIIPQAKLTADLRFRIISRIRIIEMCAIQVLTISFAALGFGPYSFALPRLITTTYSVLAIRHYAQQSTSWSIQFRRWRYIIGDSMHVLFTSLLWRAVWQGDYIILGLTATKTVVGYYFLAFSLSVQALMLAIGSISTVLFPGLSSLADDPARMCRAFFRASRAMAVVGIPICVLQTAAADPVVRLLLAPKWMPIIALTQILSIGTAFRCPGYGWSSLLKAQGRFKTATLFSAISLTIFIVLVGIGTFTYGAVGTAIGVMAHNILTVPMAVFIAAGPIGGKIREIINLFLRPLVISIISYGLGWLASFGWIAGRSSLLELITTTVIGTVYYIVLIRWFERETSNELLQHALAIAKRKQPPRPEAVPV